MSRLPRLRPELVVRRMGSGADAYVVVKDPPTRKYYKFPEWHAELLDLIDGTRDAETLVEEFNARRADVGVDAQWMADSLDGLRELGLLERSEQERHLVMMDKLKTLRRKRLYNAETVRLTQLQIPLFDPNTMMDRAIPWVRWLWSPPVVLAWLAVFGVALGFLAYHWKLYWSGFFRLVDFTRNTPLDWIALFSLVFVISIWHELGHGFTCKRFGGEVHDIGFMIFYFEPAFYCNIDDSYLFSNTLHRVYCALGGAYFELMICSLAMAAWLATPAEWAIHGLCLTIVFVTGLSGLFNLNPMLKFDGYYALMDLLDLPDLREESFRYMGNLVKRRVFRLAVAEEAISRRRRRIYLAYGLVGLLYTTTVMLFFYGLLRGWMLGWFGAAGYLVLFALLGYVLRARLTAGWSFVRHFWLDKRELLLRSPRHAAAWG
ncbi:MAG TPA: hypothetical protein VJS92_10275, partial [Candidatus Polarisedimenticolaceae bacterium]|nr:hypothetical protein [Candidatus Polarisedimenticolaceae bacterium]